MGKLEEKRTELQELVVKTKAVYSDMEEKRNAGEEIPGDLVTKFYNMSEAGKTLRKEVEALVELETADQFVNAPAHERRSQNGTPAEVVKSWGQMVIESPQFEKAGGGNHMERVEVKDLYGSAEAAGGALVPTMRDPEVVGIGMRPRSVLDMITIAQTGSNAVEFARITTRTNNAAPTKDWDTSDFVAAPESNLAFELVTANVRTIPTYVAAHRTILDDAPQLRSLINTELRYMVEKVLEDQVVNGNGTSPNLEGILNVSGIQTRTQGSISDRGGVATDTKADALRRSITDIQLSFWEVDGILLNPGDAEDLELEKDANGQYTNIYDPVALRVWRVPVVESSVITAGTALVGNFKMGATLWDRQKADIRVGEPGNMFLQTAVAILADVRAAFGVKRPTAFSKITFA